MRPAVLGARGLADSPASHHPAWGLSAALHHETGAVDGKLFPTLSRNLLSLWELLSLGPVLMVLQMFEAQHHVSLKSLRIHHQGLL